MKTNRMKKFTPYFYILPTFMILAVVIVIPIIYVIIHTGNSGCGHCIFIFTAVQRSYQFYFADNRVGEYGVGLVGRSEFGIPECGNSYYVVADRFRCCFVFGENDVNR